MSDRIKKIKVKKADGSMTDYIPIGVDAENVDFDNGYKLDNIVGSINPDESGSIAAQLSKSIKYYDCVADMKADTTLNEGGAARTLGYYEPGDGGGALYEIIDDNKSYSEVLDNGKYAYLIVNDIVNIKQLGAKGDGINDDVSIILNAINLFPAHTLYFPKGHYKISAPIVVPQGNNTFVNIEMDATTIISATQSIETAIYYGGNEVGGKYSRTNGNPVGYIKGGIIDCSLIYDGIRLCSNRQLTQVSYVTFRNISHCGLNLEKGANYSSGDFKISYCNFFRTDSYDGTGVYVACPDNEFQHIRVDGCKTAFNFNSPSNYCHDIHCTALYRTIENQVEEMNKTVAFYNSKSGNYYSECYADTYATGWKFVYEGKNYLTECTNYYYNAFLDGATTQAIWISQPEKISLNILNSHFSSARKGTHLFFRLPRSVYNQAIFDDQIHLFNIEYIDNYSTVPEYDMGYCLQLNNKNNLMPFYANQTMTAGKYYLLGIYKITNNMPVQLTFKLRNVVEANLKMTNSQIEVTGTPINTYERKWTFSIAKGNPVIIDGEEVFQTYLLLASCDQTATQDTAILLDNISVSEFFAKKWYYPIEIESPNIISSVSVSKTS